MLLLIFCFWRATVLTFLKNGLKLVKDKALEVVPKYGRTEARVSLRVAERIIIFETLQLILALYFKMLSVALSRLILIRNFFWGDIYLPSLCQLASLLLRETP